MFKFLKEDFDESKLKKLEDEYSAVTAEISYYSRKNLEDIKNEATRLRSSLKKCQENEKILVLKCQYLNEEIEENRVRVNQALKLGEEDQQTIITLTKELENVNVFFNSVNNPPSEKNSNFSRNP